jgi:hypothetical protein
MASRHCATDRFLFVSPVRSRRRMPRAQREERMLDAARASGTMASSVPSAQLSHPLIANHVPPG